MPRIRTIKPTHWNDKELAGITLQAHLLWIATWNFSDDEGIFEADPLLLKSQIFPRRTDIRVEQITQWLDQLAKARFIVPFDYNGQGYYINRTFKTHQRIDKAQGSKIPDHIISGILSEHSANVLGTVPPVLESKVLESKGKDSGKPGVEKFVFKNPFSEKFLPHWESWKTYKEKQYKFKFKSEESEQVAIDHLKKIAGGAEKIAVEIITTSIANGWKGLFELKTTNPENIQAAPKKPVLNSLGDQVRYLYERFCEGDLKETLIKQDHYDHLVVRELIPVGSFEQYPGDSILDRMRNAVVSYFTFLQSQKKELKHAS